MCLGSWLLWGTVATVVLTISMSASQRLGLTRMSLPFLIGSMFTPDRDRARLIGNGLHMGIGLIVSLVYVAIFQSIGRASWWIGASIGLGHAVYVLAIAIPALPGIHPRMASEQHGPTAARQLEPPGFFALHYGLQTPVSVLLSHALFGAMLGHFYRLAR